MPPAPFVAMRATSTDFAVFRCGPQRDAERIATCAHRSAISLQPIEVEDEPRRFEREQRLSGRRKHHTISKSGVSERST